MTGYDRDILAALRRIAGALERIVDMAQEEREERVWDEDERMPDFLGGDDERCTDNSE